MMEDFQREQPAGQPNEDEQTAQTIENDSEISSEENCADYYEEALNGQDEENAGESGIEAEPCIDVPAQKHAHKKKKKINIKSLIAVSYVICAVVFMFIGGLLTYYVVIPFERRGDYALPAPNAQGSSAPLPSVLPQKTMDGYPEELPKLGGDPIVISEGFNPVPDIVEQLEPGVVNITSQQVALNDEKQPVVKDIAGGSGFIISEEGYIVTNNHVVRDGNQFMVRDTDGIEYDAAFVGSNSELDVAVLKIDAKKRLTCLPIGSSQKLRLGEMAIAIGNPYGAGASLSGTVTVGYISSINRELMFNGKKQSFIQTDAAVNVGNSGGPLLNSNGEVIGMVTLKSLVASRLADGTTVNSEGIGFAIPIDDVMENVRQIIMSGSVKKPGIGIYHYSLTEDECEELGIECGCCVETLMSGGPAEAAGIQIGDIIVECDGVKAESTEAVSGIVANKAIGDKVMMKILRDGKYIDIEVEIGDINAIR